MEKGAVVKGVRPIGKFGKPWTILPSRSYVATADLYHTKIPRLLFWYPEFDIYKAILWNRQGDFVGKVSRIIKGGWAFNPNKAKRAPPFVTPEIWAKSCTRIPQYK